MPLLLPFSRLSRSAALALAGILGVFGATIALAFIGNLRTAPWLAGAALVVAVLSGGIGIWHARALPRRGLFAALAIVHIAGLAAPATLSDDHFRYVHEGRASRIALKTPYAVAPKDIRPPPDDGVSAKVNHPEIPAAYPPFSQLVFLLTATLSDAMGSPFALFRLLFLLADLAVMAVLYRRATNPLAFAWWGFHPLPLLECAIGGHVDALGVALLAFAFFAARRPWARGLAVGLSIGVKPIAALVFVGFRVLPRPLIVSLGAAAAAVALCAAPYLATGAPILKGLTEYSTRWEAQATGYALVEAPLAAIIGKRNADGKWAHLQMSRDGARITEAGRFRFEVGAPTRFKSGPGLLLDARFFARLFVLGLMLLMFGLIAWRIAHRTWAVALAFLVFLLLTPAVHPWYWLWVLPFACAVTSRGLWAAAALAPLSYEAAMRFAATGEWTEAWWPRVILLAALAGGLVVDVKRWRKPRDLEESQP